MQYFVFSSIHPTRAGDIRLIFFRNPPPFHPAGIELRTIFAHICIMHIGKAKNSVSRSLTMQIRKRLRTSAWPLWSAGFAYFEFTLLSWDLTWNVNRCNNRILDLDKPDAYENDSMQLEYDMHFEWNPSEEF